MSYHFTELTPLEYLKIDIAANYDGKLDKENWDVRTNWFDTHLTERLGDLLDDHNIEEPKNQEQKDRLSILLKEAENPALYYAGIKAYRDALQGIPNGYAISLDACSSGMQILSLLSGCEKSASLCGVVNIGQRADSYTTIYKVMCKALGEQAQIKRDDCKQAIMTSLYSSTRIPKEVFGEDELLDTFHHTMEVMAPGAWELNQDLQQLWQPYALTHDWVLPDNFHVHKKVKDTEVIPVLFRNRPVDVLVTLNKGTKEGRSISPDIVHSLDGMIVREMYRRCSFDTDKMIELISALDSKGTRNKTPDDKMVILLWDHFKKSDFLSARILDHLSAFNIGHVDALAIAKLIQTLPLASFELMTVHDCFRCLPNYGNDVRRQYNQILHDIAKSDMLSYLASQITGNYMPVIKRGDFSAKILDADYSLS